MSTSTAQGGVQRIWLLVAAAVAAGALYVLLEGDGGAPDTPEPAPEEVVLQLGPWDVTDVELNNYVDYAREVDPSLAPSQVRRIHLLDLLLPKRIVATIVPRERIAQAREKAERIAAAVAQSGGGIDALREAGRPFDLRDEDQYYPPFTLALDVSRAVFAVGTGQVTGPVHSVYGSVVAGAVGEKIENGVRKRRIVSVFFPYGGGEMLRSRVLERLRGLYQEPAWVHPKYRDEFALRFRRLRDEPIRDRTARSPENDPHR